MAGIVGIYSKTNATLDAYAALYNTQTRGQENCGISAAGDNSLRTYKGKRLISAIFHPSVLKSFSHPKDYVVIGHVGDQKTERGYIAPFQIESNNYNISVAMDGMILNRSEIDKECKTDEELFGKIFLKYMEKTDDVKKASSKTIKDLDQAYFSLVIALHDKERNKSELIGIRDKRGIRPMYFGRTESGIYISSESGAIDNLETIGNIFIEKRDVIPGEMIKADPKFKTHQLTKSKKAHCIFEWIYSARADAIIEGKTAHTVRKETGHYLAKLHKIKDDGNTIIIGVPDSGRSVGAGISEKTNIHLDEGIIKNQYIGRTYVIPDHTERNMAAALKHNIIKDVVKNKTTIFGDDSIVRGTISEAIAKNLRNAGAKKVKMAISYGPIFYPCFSDEENKRLATDEYVGDKSDIIEIGKYVAGNLPSVDKVMFNSVENIIKSVGLDEKDLCTYCMTGKNPFKD